MQAAFLKEMLHARAVPGQHSAFKNFIQLFLKINTSQRKIKTLFHETEYVLFRTNQTLDLLFQVDFGLAPVCCTIGSYPFAFCAFCFIIVTGVLRQERKPRKHSGQVRHVPRYSNSKPDRCNTQRVLCTHDQ